MEPYAKEVVEQTRETEIRSVVYDPNRRCDLEKDDVVTRDSHDEILLKRGEL